MKKKVLGAAYTVLDLLRSPSYAVPLLVNLTGSVWFFVIIGGAGEFLGGVFFRLGVLGWGKGRQRMVSK